MANESNVISPQGRKKLEEELLYLETERRDEIGERIKVAREFGDISENSEYDDAKNEQAMNEARISEIKQTLRDAVVVDPSKRSGRVNIGATVTVEMNGKEREFVIVGTAESNVAENKISNESPVGAALFGRKKGDEVNAVGPTGREIKMKVKKIEYKDE